MKNKILGGNKMKYEYTIKGYDCCICETVHDIKVYSKRRVGVTNNNEKYDYELIYAYCENDFDGRELLNGEDCAFLNGEMIDENYKRRNESIARLNKNKLKGRIENK